MADYDFEALKAKGAFLMRLKRYMKRNGLWQKDIAATIGLTNSSVSSAMKAPENVSENFIRLVSRKIPDLADEYARFRAAVDGPYTPSKVAEPGNSRDAQLQLFDETIARIIELLEALRRAL